MPHAYYEKGTIRMLREYLIGLSLANMVLISIWLKYFYKVNFYVRALPTAKSF